MRGCRHSRRVIALLVGVFLIFGGTLSVAQAGDMSTKMAMSAVMSDSGSGTCGDCGGTTGGKKSTHCIPMCAPVHGAAVLPIGSAIVAPKAIVSSLPEYEFGRGCSFSPDPYPPKPIDLG